MGFMVMVMRWLRVGEFGDLICFGEVAGWNDIGAVELLI
jgi:hypothetical protein